MKWKDVVVGSLATLVVTVVGGVAIYYLTREPSRHERSEDLAYELDQPVTFESDQTKVSFANLRLRNVGTGSAKNVVVTLQFSVAAKVLDKKVSLSTAPAGKFEIASTPANLLELRIPVLTPRRIGVGCSANGKERAPTTCCDGQERQHCRTPQPNH
jgi:hypothetical protein